jgi:ribonucleotide monophosphatase NagD (HAD superfamily)
MRTRDAYLQLIDRIGLIGFTKEQIFSSGYALGLYLKECNFTRVFVHGITALVDEIQLIGITALTGHVSAEEEDLGIEAIIISDSPNFTYNDLKYAIYLHENYKCPLIGPNPDPTVPGSTHREIVGTGSIIASFGRALGEALRPDVSSGVELSELYT